MGEKRAYKPRKPGGGRRKSKPEYDAEKILKELMDSAVVLYDAGMSLQAIADELGLNPIKVRKLLITAGVYVSDMAEKVQVTFDDFRKTQDHKAAVLSTANALGLSRSSWSKLWTTMLNRSARVSSPAASRLRMCMM